MILEILMALAGGVLLYFGGELLVGGATSLARRMGISSLVVGLTVVAFGTSAPELASSLSALFRGSPDIVIGNVIGSNIANLALILGISALVSPIMVNRIFLDRELPFLMGVSGLLVLMVWNGSVFRWEGLAFILLLVFYLMNIFRKKVGEEVPSVDSVEEAIPAWKSLCIVVAGIAMLTFGSDLFVRSAIFFARTFGVSERVIGITMVALGTSLPELASSLVAALRGEQDLILGNLVGSNIFNILAILGVASQFGVISIPSAAMLGDVLLMIGIPAALVFMVWRGGRIARLDGALLLVVYCGYVFSLVR